MYSHTTILGRLVRDPELKYTAQGTEVCTISMAVDSGWGDKKKTSFFDVTIFGKRAETVNQYLNKGSLALVDGRLEQQRWEDKDSGQKRSKVVIIANDVKFMPKQTSGQEPTIPPTDDEVPF